MNRMRDEDLGRALAALDVPDHGEGFWDDLAARLRAEAATAAPGVDPAEDEPEHQADVRDIRERTRPLPRAPEMRVTVGADRRWLASAAVAAVAALLVAAAVVIADAPDRTGTAPVATTPTDPTPTGPDTTQAPPAAATPASLTATVEVGLDDGSERRFSLVADRDGSRTVRDLGTGELLVRDVGDGTDVYVPPTDGSQETNAYRRRGVPAGGPSARFGDPISRPEIVSHVLTLVAAGDPAVREVEALGRPAWRLDTEVTPNAIGGGPDATTAVVDQETGLLLLLEERVGGQLFISIEVTSLETHEAPADPDAFEVDGDAQVVEEGFARITVDELRAGAVGDAVLIPTSLPEGFELATVDVLPGTGPSTGAEGMNPPAVDSTVLVYRRGWEELVITSWRTGADPGAWEDPFGGEGQVVQPETATVVGGALDGTDVEVVVDPTTMTHLWGAGPSGVVTISSTARLTTEQLLEVAGALEGAS